MTAPQVPGPTDVGAMYDRFNDLFTRHLGDNLHLGFWTDDQDDATATQATDRITDTVADLLAPAPGTEVLDVGCGSGRSAVRIAGRHRVHVTGITVSAHQVRLAQARPGAGPGAGRASFQLADAMELPFPDGRFDGAYAIESLLHMADRAGAVAEIARTLSPGARLVVLDFYQDRGFSPPETDVMNPVFRAFRLPPLPGAGEYQQHLAAAGLEVTGLDDITGNVRRSHRLIADAMQNIADEFDLDEETRGQLHRYVELNGIIGLHPGVHYALITARRP
ncbi:methyltransferase domain-containing protein [Streptomyces sp. A3M-1-3]|uniref:methyltransferase domain-containing protein n=1 Tax=Streptomyces sp. A3M-1-3 TaxID=2962044 RepID=UPI0020B77868|nr:methyltransferase domain-containing protein [Streptomyces sp. A3M-1-3]MCP3819386.1 methyltransferase domain-containing protein [Streptomyces sp. A3M-1-3]